MSLSFQVSIKCFYSPMRQHGKKIMCRVCVGWGSSWWSWRWCWWIQTLFVLFCFALFLGKWRCHNRHSPNWPWTLDSSYSAFSMLGLEVCTTMASWIQSLYSHCYWKPDVSAKPGEFSLISGAFFKEEKLHVEASYIRAWGRYSLSIILGRTMW